MLAHEAPSETIHTPKKILVLDLDMDGCLFNSNYMLSSSPNRLIEANEDLIASIVKEILENGYDEVVIMNGSSRQSREIDSVNSWVHNKGSCFPALITLTAEIQNRLNLANPENPIPCHFDNFLLADLYGEKPAGENFTHALAENEDYNYSVNIFDDSKLNVLYPQMQRVAAKYRRDNITFALYDDRWRENRDILDSLADFFDREKELIPSNVELSLRHYAGDAITLVSHIEGTGIIDDCYRSNTLLMTECTGHGCANSHIQANFFINFNDASKLAAFKAMRSTDIVEGLVYAIAHHLPDLIIDITHSIQTRLQQRSIDRSLLDRLADTIDAALVTLTETEADLEIKAHLINLQKFTKVLSLFNLCALSIANNGLFQRNHDNPTYNLSSLPNEALEPVEQMRRVHK